MKNYILEARKFIKPKICEKIISYFGDDFQDAKTTGHGNNKTIRNCLVTHLHTPKSSSFGKKIITNYLYSKIFQIADMYNEQHDNYTCQKVTQLDLLKYEKNEHKVGYNFHHDQGHKCAERSLSVSICLSNDYEGGEFVFNLDGEHIQYPQNIGDVIAFPSNFMFPHQVNPVSRGVRFAIVSWLI